MTDTKPWIVSVDDHVIEPPNVWRDRLPAKFHDVGPRVEKINGADHWVYESRNIPTPFVMASVGLEVPGSGHQPISYDEMRPGCYDPLERVKDMNEGGILAQTCFPTFPRFCGQTFLEADDKDLALLCVQAYNDWHLDEWAGAAPGRFIPMIIVPLWDPQLAAAEIERCADRGAKALAFTENGAPLGLPTIANPGRHWDPMLAALNDTGIVCCMHIGSSSRMPASSPESPLLAQMGYSAGVLMSEAMLDWIFSGTFSRFPNVKIALSEGGIGWMPYFLEFAAHNYERHRWAANMQVDLETMQIAPVEGLLPPDFSVRETFENHVFGCFVEDYHGVEAIETIGVNNVMIETDYPHAECHWPGPRDFALKQLEGLDDETVFKVMRGNAERVFGFVPAEQPA